MLRCATCARPFVVCEDCYDGQRFCGDDCEQEARRVQERQARRRYEASRKGKFKRLEINRRYYLRRAKRAAEIKTDHDSTQGKDREISPPDVARVQEGSAIRAAEGPGHDVEVEVRSPSGVGSPSDAGERAVGLGCAQGEADQHPAAPASPAYAARGRGLVERPSLDHCRVCGAVIRWLVDRDGLRRRAVARRQSVGAFRDRGPRLPKAACGPG